MIEAPVQFADQSSFRVRPMHIGDVPSMNTLFIQSMDIDYDYFPDYFKKKLIRDHSKLKLYRSILSPKSYVLLAAAGHSLIENCIVHLEKAEPATLL